MSRKLSVLIILVYIPPAGGSCSFHFDIFLSCSYAKLAVSKICNEFPAYYFACFFKC